MAHPLLSVRMPKTMLKEIEKITEKERFSSNQETIRQAIREYLEKKKNQQLDQEILAFAGMNKGKPLTQLSLEERNALVKEIQRKIA